jgi:Mg-chelatase subunit ChlD
MTANVFRRPWITALLTAACVLVITTGGAFAASPGPVFDPSSSGGAAPQWVQGLTELTGAYAEDGAVASGLLAGETGDFRARVSLFATALSGGLTGVVFGHRGPQELWLAGFNPQENRFEILHQTGNGIEVLASEEDVTESGGRVTFEVLVQGRGITLTHDGKKAVAAEAPEDVHGQAGIGAVHVDGYGVLVEDVQIMAPDGSPRHATPSYASWVPFRAAGLVEGTGTWGPAQVLTPAAGGQAQGPRAALLLLSAAAGDRYRHEVEIRNLTGLRGFGIVGMVFGYSNATSYNVLGLDPEFSRIELWHRSAAGFEPLASARLDITDEWLNLRLDAERDRAMVQAGNQTLFDLRDPRFTGPHIGLATFGTRDWPAVWRSQSFAARGEALPPKEPDDLLALHLGARALLLEPPSLDRWEALVDHPVGNAGAGTGEPFPVEGLDGPAAVVFAFPYQRLARIELLEAATDGETGPIRCLASLDSPLPGVTELAVLHPKPGGMDTAVIDPVTARYLKLELSEPAGKEGHVAEVFVRGSLQGRASDRRAQAPQADAPDRQEREPNDSLELAMRLQPAVWVGGDTGFGDIDHYRLNLPAEGGTVVVTGRSLGAVPALYAVLDPQGRTVEPKSVLQSPPDWIATYELGGGPWYLRVSGEPVSLTVMFDDSGSMGEARDALPKLLLGLADRVGPGLRVKLMKFAETPVEIFDFIDDPKVLREAVEREVEASGGTETMAGLLGGLDSLRGVAGNRALLVALDGFDGFAEAEDFHTLWARLLETAAPVYIIGVGSEEWDSEDRLLGLSDRNLFSELAWASRGQFLVNPTLQDFERCVGDILASLSKAVPYQVRAEFTEGNLPPGPKGQGSVQVRLDEKQATEPLRTVELILDASNSMWGRIADRSKIEIARDVLLSVLESLPDGVHLGLRVYGHRWPRTDGRACTDSELVFPIGPLDRTALIRHIKGVTPKGRTPLVHSLLQTPQDFQGLPRGTVILVSDGIESCDGRIEDVASVLRESGIDLTVHVVGFDVRERSSREELERTALALGGRYFDAADAGALSESLHTTLRIEYEVLAADGSVAARGQANGEPVTLDEGEYRLRVLLEPTPVEAPIQILPGEDRTYAVSAGEGGWKISGP